MDYKMEELLPIVSELAQKYTGYESTSVTYEKAQMLMGAVLYCLKEYEHSLAGAENPAGAKGGVRKDSLSVKDGSAREWYEAGARLVLEKAAGIREIFNELSAGFSDFGVKCLHDTVQKGIPEFLKWYDAAFCPQDTILTLDYPLLTDISSLNGVDAVYQYISDVRTEQRFLEKLERKYITNLLERYDPSYRDMAENICRIVLPNIIGHIAVKTPLGESGAGVEEYAVLSGIFKEKTIPDIENTIKYFMRGIVNRFYENNKDILAYLYQDAGNLAVRIGTAARYERLDKVFLL